jgi:hypothetical protein
MKSGVLLVLLAISLSTGCLVSEQVGERTHVNSPAPEEITFHFDSPFNKTLVYGRSAALLAVALWVFSLRRGASALGPIVLAVALAVTSVSLLWLGWTKMHDYRIDVRSDHLHLVIPGESELRLEWFEIEEIKVEGMALNVDMGGPGMKWSPQWEDLKIVQTGGEVHDVDLRPLSVEQRGTFWRAIVSKAQLSGEVRVIPTKRR